MQGQFTLPGPVQGKRSVKSSSSPSTSYKGTTSVACDNSKPIVYTRVANEPAMLQAPLKGIGKDIAIAATSEGNSQTIPILQSLAPLKHLRKQKLLLKAQFRTGSSVSRSLRGVNGVTRQIVLR